MNHIHIQILAIKGYLYRFVYVNYVNTINILLYKYIYIYISLYIYMY